MFLESAQVIRSKIEELISTHRAQESIGMAVAFWGEGADDLIPSGRPVNAICNLAMGGTNPTVVGRAMARPQVRFRHLSDLHAKVVVASGGAVVSSANLSANGLGLAGRSGTAWKEAGVFIAAGDPEFARVYAWFVERWNEAEPVTAAILADAAQAWERRAAASDYRPPASLEGESAPPGNEDADSVPELTELDLFQPQIKPRNAIRMAADWLVEEYARIRGGTLAKSDNYIPAYAAHVIWTASGRRMQTNIQATPEFSRPEQVLRRAEERGREYPDRVRNLVGRIARSPSASDAVRYWAEKALDMGL